MRQQFLDSLIAASTRTAQLLASTDSKLVFAESCTSGLLAATLSQLPGISQHFCGSFVTYRESMKSDALGVPPAIIKIHTAVSRQTTASMLEGALQQSSEATVALAITGHLGPNAPADLDGRVFIACQHKNGDAPTELHLKLESSQRTDRQHEAATAAFVELNSLLERMIRT
ncbi:CinA family protein [Planctomycetes bacterium K23_9]|uniref:Nicotinamide-nucleotide amidohydrolase PncC n=1 Tax=Stieleria marina TaxID=1930275 RepID=A0A517P1Q6_9BACT|nr:Nicotinamide-nucleotide amidohydrolase PncC [Planctomycetes bacterium K23_9]